MFLVVRAYNVSGSGELMSDYSKMRDEDFDRILTDILNEIRGGQLLSIPGIYEIVSEEFNDEILDRWDQEQVEEEREKE